jgi:nucleotide-binding universal stress UspA family protein
MLNRILVPLDGTPTGEAALPYAEALARRSGALLVLIHAVHARLQGNLPVGPLQAVEEGQAYLATVAEQLKQRGVAAEIGLPYGAAEAWIAEEIDMRKADLVVMATHDRGRPARWLHPSIAEAVVGQADVPVLITRADVLPTAERFTQPQPVLVVPLDGSALSEAALPVATELATWLNASLVLLRVAPAQDMVVPFEPSLPGYRDQDIEPLSQDAEAYLARIECGLPTELTVETVVRQGHPAAEISAAVAAAYGAAAVVMATHGRTGPLRSLLGSVAGGVVHRSPVPVILVRPKSTTRAKTQLLAAAHRYA